MKKWFETFENFCSLSHSSVGLTNDMTFQLKNNMMKYSLVWISNKHKRNERKPNTPICERTHTHTYIHFNKLYHQPHIRSMMIKDGNKKNFFFVWAKIVHEKHFKLKWWQRHIWEIGEELGEKQNIKKVFVLQQFFVCEDI
jgi:hypothetical protein